MRRKNIFSFARRNMKKYFFLAGNGELGLVLRTKPAEHRVCAIYFNFLQVIRNFLWNTYGFLKVPYTLTLLNRFIACLDAA